MLTVAEDLHVLNKIADATKNAMSSRFKPASPPIANPAGFEANSGGLGPEKLSIFQNLIFSRPRGVMSMKSLDRIVGIVGSW